MPNDNQARSVSGRYGELYECWTQEQPLNADSHDLQGWYEQLNEQDRKIWDSLGTEG